MNISRIELNDFEAFPVSETIDLEGGRNLLLYGENGAGKSSLFRAVRELFNLRTGKAYEKHRNIFTARPRCNAVAKALHSGHSPPVGLFL